MTAIYDMDPSTSTIATAWAASDLGDPETGPTEFWAAPQSDELADRRPSSIGRHARFAAVLAGVFGVGAAFGLAVFDFADWAPPTITLPYVSTQDGGTPAQTESALPMPVPASDNMPKPIVVVQEPTPPSPKPTVSAPEDAPATVVAPTVESTPGPVEVISPPANVPGDGKATVDLTIPAPPDAVPVPDDPDAPEPKTPKPTLQIVPETDSTALQPVQPPKLVKPRTTLNDALSPGSNPKADPSPKPSQRTTLSKP